ncbi:MAG: MBL fold metallo-hydrolase [Actinomycetota bacterium]|nr:MBL fold metallo-hydrolase [Actinomycetota bacterium]
MRHHYEGEDLVLRKIEVGSLGNNVYVLECPETHESLIVDGCFEADKILSGADGSTVVGIVQTHGHQDHVQALADLEEKLAVPVYAHAGDDYPVRVDRQIEGGDEISFGNRTAKVLYTPGHTPGGVCYLVGRHLIAGDTLFPGGPGNTRGNPAAFAQIIASIESKLFSLPDDTPVYPGHGADTTIGTEKPHLQEWVDRGW